MVILMPYSKLPRAIVLAAVILAGVVLGGCGQRGPLYLPTKPEPVKPAPAPSSAPADRTSPVAQ